jgi:hypothetical protein
MALTLNLGSIGSLALDAQGDLAKHLTPGLDTIVNFHPDLAALMTTAISSVPAGSVSTDFTFSEAPSWQITQAVGITLSINPAASSKLTFVQPGGTIFSYTTADGAETNPVNAAPGRFYVCITLGFSLALDAGAKFSSGNFGVSGDLSTDAELHVSYYHAVDGAMTLGDALGEAFSGFVLPFQSAGISAMPGGDYLDFDFLGKLALGIGATYGLSGLFFAGRSQGEVLAAFESPLGSGLVSAAPSFQAGAAFQVQYSHAGAFRVVVGRTHDAASNSASLYLFRADIASLTTTETLGITLSANAQFQLDPATLQGQLQQAGQNLIPGDAGVALGNKLAAAGGSAVGAVNSGVNALLARANNQAINLELLQSRTSEQMALFIYRFDFNQQGLAAYDSAMQGDYAKALTFAGTALDPCSFVEQLYVQSAGLNLQIFDLLKFQDLTEYIQKTDISYLGDRTFQIRATLGVRSVSGIVGKQREADLFFIAQHSAKAGAATISALDVRLHAVFLDQSNATAFGETERMLAALEQSDAAAACSRYAGANPKGAIKITIDLDAALCRALFAGPLQDPDNYAAFSGAVVAVIGAADRAAETYESSFARYPDWLAFNRVVNGLDDDSPGDRHELGNLAGGFWPEGHPPPDPMLRGLVQTYIIAGQGFMNFCESVKALAGEIQASMTDRQYDAMLGAIQAMVKDDLPYPTYFLKPAMVALMRLLPAQLKLDGALPVGSPDTFSLSLKSEAAAAQAG